MRVALTAALIVALAAASPARAESDPLSVEARVSQDTVLLGGAVQMQVLVKGARSARGPAASAFGDDFEVKLLQESPGSRSETVIVKGRLSSKEEVWYAFIYELRPRRDGELIVPALDYRAGDETLRTEALSLSVIGPRASAHALLDVSYAPSRIYVEQALTLRLRASLTRLSLGDEVTNADPFLTRDPPELRIPWIDGTDDLAASETEQYLARLETQRGAGFSVNALMRSSFFGRGDIRLFRLKREPLDRGGAKWFAYSLERVVVPLRSGKIALPAASIVGDVVTKAETTAGGGARATDTETVFVTHEPVVIDVLPIPTVGRPPTYTHAVGRFLVEASATPHRAQVGDPIQVVMRVDGAGLLDRLKTPALDKQADLARDFSVSEAEPPGWDGSARVFTYTLRPRHARVTSLPPLVFASFDPESASFREQRTERIPIEVEDAGEVSPSELEVAGGGAAVTSTPGAEVAGGLEPNAGLTEILGDEPYAPWRGPVFWLALLLPLLALIGVLGLQARRSAHDDAALRARRALPVALEEVEAARVATDEIRQADGLSRALAGFVAARTGRSAGGLTAEDVGSILRARSVDTALVDDVVAGISTCEAARYGGQSALRDALRDAESWLGRLDEELPL